MADKGKAKPAVEGATDAKAKEAPAKGKEAPAKGKEAPAKGKEAPAPAKEKAAPDPKAKTPDPAGPPPDSSGPPANPVGAPPPVPPPAASTAVADDMGKGKKKDKKDRKSKVVEENAPPDAPVVTDSINPFVDLPTAPPTATPTAAPSAVAPAVIRKRKSSAKAPPPILGMGQGAPPMGGRPGWRRVSTRQWIRDFREHIGKFQTYPYKPICGMFFWSFGYYPDMVPQDSYNRYVAKHPISTKRHSTGSGHMIPRPGPLPPGATDTSMSMTSTDASKMTDDNMNLPPLVPPTDKGTKGDEGAPAEKAEPAGKSKKDKKKSIKGDEAASESEGEGKTEKKSRKSKKGGDDAAAAAVAGGAAAAEGGKEKKGKSKKGDKAADAEPAASEGEGGKESKKGKKDKKGKEKPVSAVSGNISFDPAVYDLTTLTVMNLPPNADAKKLKKLFPGSTITMENGGATVKFPDAAAAEPFFTKEIVMDGQALVTSPKLKS